MGAARVAGTPGLHRALRGDLSRSGPTNVGGTRHPAFQRNDSWTLTGHQSHSEPVHRADVVVPDESGITPGYQQLEIDDELLRRRSVTIASGMPEHSDDTAITIRNRHAALHGARLQTGNSVELPQAPYLHLFVPRGEVTLEGAGPLHEGDAVRFTASGGQRVTATEPSEILLWEMHAGFGRGISGLGSASSPSSCWRGARAAPCRTRRRPLPRRPRPPPRRPRGWRRSPSMYQRTWRRPHSTNRDRRRSRRAGHSRCGPGFPAPGSRRGPPTERCWYRCRARGRWCAWRPVAPARANRCPARRPGPAARPGVRRVHALCRRERPGRRLRLRQRSRDQPAHRRRRARRTPKAPTWAAPTHTR